MTIITYCPLRDGPWLKKPRKTRLGWENAQVGAVILAYGSEQQVKESLTRVHISRLLDWTWTLRRRPDLDPKSGSRCWECRRVA